MGYGFEEIPFDDATRTRNRWVVSVATLGAVAVTLVVAATTDFPWGNAIAGSGLWLFFGACLWWMYGSKKAGHLRLDDNAKQYFRRIMKTQPGRGGPDRP